MKQNQSYFFEIHLCFLKICFIVLITFLFFITIEPNDFTVVLMDDDEYFEQTIKTYLKYRDKEMTLDEIASDIFKVQFC